MLKSLQSRARSAAVLGVAAALAVGGVAAAQNGGDGKSGGSEGAAKQGKRHAKRMGPPPGGPIAGPLGKNLTYAEFHVQRNGEAEVHRIDRGEIVSVSASEITLSENDGNEVTIAVDGDTKVLAGPGSDKSVTDLNQGQRVLVAGPEGGTAKAVMVPPKRGQKPGGQKGGPRAGRLPPPPPMRG